MWGRLLSWLYGMFFVHEEAPLYWQRWVLKLPEGDLRLYFSASGIGLLTLPGQSAALKDEPPFADGELPWPGLSEELPAFFQGREIKGEYPPFSRRLFFLDT